MNQELIKELSRTSPEKIVMLIIDGLGGLPDPATGKSELETAILPNLDALAARSICGLADPVGPGITPGSGPGHLAVFGYDPITCQIGRGALEAVGIDVELQPNDVAARGNFCTVDENGIITDRRAGRVATNISAKLCELLEKVTIPGITLLVRPVREHRFVVVFRGDGLVAEVTESDPSQKGVKPLPVAPESPDGRKLAGVANEFIEKAAVILAGRHPANMVLLRGFARKPDFPTMQEIYKLNPLAIALYSMYRGLARLVGMDVDDSGGSTLQDEIKALKKNYGAYDFFFVHVKWTDSAGEDGDFARKVKILEEVDAVIPSILALKPDVLVVTGDHSTPAAVQGHSWHPVPVLINAKHCRPDAVTEFTETAFIAGGLGRILSSQIMPLAMANALKLNKYGA
ncbi:MAG: 2,3-bisphosphoglycerate-independent phosphoglycerate mutase [Dehalococcoidales bacterium]|nr:2,3-bisphosphoglycerate-independent phosphoglycerate mutase [Dehalococcoidales bacterium]